jgi:uncharacterized RDD family membrane protein YckC
MGCPQCHSDEISPSGVCLICGCRIEEEQLDPSGPKAETVPDARRSYSGLIEMDYSEETHEPSEQNEVPEWRMQLSQRLHEIKQKREAIAVTKKENQTLQPLISQPKAAESPSAQQAKLLPKAPVRKPRVPSAPVPQQKTLQPLEPPAVPNAAPTDPQEIRNLIDSAVSRQVAQTGPPSVGSPIPPNQPEEAVRHEDKLILLSRTLSGLVDLIVVVLCTGAFIFAADYFSGILALDNFSLALFFILFLLNYFMYSLFFLSSSNQTIGMMITDLRVVGANDRRPSTQQILRRCGGYLVSLFFLGIGLLLGLFDRGSRCFHDRISGTHVVRI